MMELLDILKSNKLVRLPNSVRIVLVMLLSDRYNVVSFVSFPSDGGIEPVIRFSERSRVVSLVRLEMDGGMKP